VAIHLRPKLPDEKSSEKMIVWEFAIKDTARQKIRMQNVDFILYLF